MRPSISPGKSPKTTTSVPSGTSVSDLDRADVGEVVAEAPEELGDLAAEQALEHPEQVAGRQDHDEAGDRRDPRVVRPGPEEDEELPDEAGQAGQPDRGEHEEPEHRGVDRRDRRQAAHLGDRPVVGPLVDDPDEEEQGARDDPVADHLEDRPVQARRLEHEDAQGHEAHVAHRRVGDELLEVGLDEGHDRAVDDRDEAQHDDRRPERLAPPPGRAAARSG